jgi:hypothetical protein
VSRKAQYRHPQPKTLFFCGNGLPVCSDSRQHGGGIRAKKGLVGMERRKNTPQA